jgi:hypothetical protein
VNNLLKTIADRTKIELVEESTEDLKKYGLDNPNTIVRVTFETMPSKMLMIGNRLTERGKTTYWYAKQMEKDLIFTLENSVHQSLNYSIGYYIKRNQVQFDRNNVDKIILESSHEPVTFVKDAEKNWNVISPFDKNVDNQVASTLFFISFSLVSSGLYSFEPTTDEIKTAGLDKPQAVVSLFIKDKMVSKVEFGKTYYEKEPITYFRTSNSPSIFITKTTLQSMLNYISEEVYGD